MLQALEKEKNAREKVLTIQPTERVERLRQRYLDTPDKVLIDALRITTRVMKETEGEPMVIRRAKAFAATVRGVPINIFPDELFVGWLWHEPHGTELMADSAYHIEKELDTLATREISPFLISDDIKRELKEEIFPYWRARHYSPPVPAELKEAGIEAIGAAGTLFHFVVDYEKVLEKGFLGVKQEAEDRLARLDLTDSEDLEKLPFLEAVILATEAASDLGERFAARARELAESEADTTRKAELLKIAEVCDQVPANPARTLHEAMQSVWFAHILVGWDTGHHGGQSPGKVDQYFYPYYESDIEAGRVTKAEAQELLDCWCMRYSQMFSVQSEIAARYLSNHTSVHDITVGGLKADGTDATNDLSYMFIEAMMHTPGMVEPALVFLVHSRTPEDLLIKACQLASLGGSWPMFVNQDLMIENLLSRGDLGGPPVSLETVRQLSTTNGCHHPCLAGMESGWGAHQAASSNPPTLLAALEFVLLNGKRRYDRKKTGLETGDPRQFKSFEEFREAYKKQLARLERYYSIGDSISQTAMRRPTVLTSALTADCIEKGKSREEGGARYNIGASSLLVGSVDVGDSLAAIKRLVFDEQKITMDRLLEALDSNFEGYEDVRQMCLEAPKFGNDDDYVDEQVAWVTHLLVDEARKYKTTYGGPRLGHQTPMSGYVPLGILVGALPSGRLSGQPLADALSPTVGSDLKGPTAILKSVGKVNNAEVALGSTLNMKLDPVVFENEDGVKRLADFIRTFVDQKADEVQINVASAETFRAAQKEPEKYRDLVVKVAGYSARFVALHKEIQDSIIARTAHQL